MPSLKELQEKRLALHNQIKEHADKQATWNAEDNAKWDELNRAYDENKAALDTENKAIEDAAKRQKDIADRVAAINAHGSEIPFGRDNGSVSKGPVNKPRFSPEDLGGEGNAGDNLANALHGWLLNGSELATLVNEKHINSAKAVGASLSAPVFQFNLNRDWQGVKASANRFKNALSGEDGTSGGYTKDQMLVNSLELAMLAFGGMAQVASVIRTSTGEPMRWPTADDTDNTGAQIGENTSHDSGSDPTFGSVVWNAYTFSSKIVKVPNELLQDSHFSLPTELGKMLGERLGRIKNTKYTVGTGAGTAKGITLCATAGVSAASATAIAFDELIDLEHSLDPSRRGMPGVGYMFHDSILKALRKLKDGEGRYLWQAGANSGAPDTLNTYPYTVNQDMASAIAASAITVLFGDMSAYKIREVGQVVLRRLDERFADTNQTGFLALVRGDGNLLDAGDGPVRKLTQAAS